jgi:hypothetical protein
MLHNDEVPETRRAPLAKAKNMLNYANITRAQVCPVPNILRKEINSKCQSMVSLPNNNCKGVSLAGPLISSSKGSVRWNVKCGMSCIFRDNCDWIVVLTQPFHTPTPPVIDDAGTSPKQAGDHQSLPEKTWRSTFHVESQENVLGRFDKP